MGFFSKLGNFLMIRRKHRRVRTTLIFLFTNSLILASVIFLVELIVILFGIYDVSLHLPIRSDILRDILF
jgi:hypothetical protein